MAGSELLIELFQLDGAAVLGVRGEVDAATAPAFREAVTRAHDLGVPVVFDLTGVTFMDSSGLHVLLEASRAQDKDHPSQLIRDASRQVRRLLELTGLECMIGPRPERCDTAWSLKRPSRHAK